MTRWVGIPLAAFVRGLRTSLQPVSFVALFVLALGGCAGDAPPPDTLAETGHEVPEEPVASVPTTSAAVPEPEPRPRPPVTPAAAPDGDGTVLAAIPPEVTEMPDFSDLMGLDFAGVEARLGVADLVHDAPPGKEWEYRDGDCVLIVRFYPDLKTLDYRVLSFGFDSKKADSANDEDCRKRFTRKLRPTG